jgi:hypothetical protein
MYYAGKPSCSSHLISADLANGNAHFPHSSNGLLTSGNMPSDTCMGVMNLENNSMIEIERWYKVTFGVWGKAKKRNQYMESTATTHDSCKEDVRARSTASITYHMHAVCCILHTCMQPASHHHAP